MFKSIFLIIFLFVLFFTNFVLILFGLNNFWEFVYDFLIFYARFSTDTLYQQSHVEQPLKVTVLDPEDDNAYIEGTIDAEQWRSFCPDVPHGVISNIRYGAQKYNSRQIVMQKSGSSNGLQELFIFMKEDGEWRLTTYEN